MSMKKILESEYETIVDLYHNGYSQQKIADRYNVSSVTIGSILKKRNVQCARNKISQSEYDNIASLYLSGASAECIAKQYNVCGGTIAKVLDQCEILKRKSGDYSRRYAFNEHYFDEFVSNKQAYILGLLYADGCNYPPQNQIRIELQERDKDILERINVELNNEKPLKFYDKQKYHPTYQNTYAIELCSQHFANILNELGVVPRKSLILTFPDWLSQDFYASFLLGYSDGDGCISKDASRASWSIIGTEEFCSRVATILTELVGVDKCILHTTTSAKENNTNTRVLYVNGITNVKRVLDWLYADAELYMQRKYDIYKSIYYDNT